MKEDEAIRLECLRLAQEVSKKYGPADAGAVVIRARTYADFIIGGHDAEVIAATCDLTKRIEV